MDGIARSNDSVSTINDNNRDALQKRNSPNTEAKTNSSVVHLYDLLIPTTDDPCEFFQSLNIFNGSFNELCNNFSLFNNSSMDPAEIEPAPRDYTWGALAMLPFIMFGIAGNTLVCIAICLERKLQSVTNYFLLSLAITDLLVSLLVMPFSLIHSFLGFWPFGVVLCNLFVTSDVLMCTCSIFHLCTISFERFLAIRYPLKTRNKSRSVVILKIILIWAFSIGVSCPITVLGGVRQENILNENQCILMNDDFVIYGSIFAFFIPLLIMITMYILTVYLLQRQANMCKVGASQDRNGLIRRSRSTSRNGSTKDKRRKTGKGKPCKSQSFPIRKQSLDSPDSHGNTSQYGHAVNLNKNVDRFDETNPIMSASSNASDTIQDDTASNTNINTNNKSLTLDNIALNHSVQGLFRRSRPQSTTSDDQSEQSSDTQPLHQITTTTFDSNLNTTTTTTTTTANTAPKFRKLLRKHNLAIKAANLLLLRRDLAAKRNAVRNEQKASKVLGIVFIIFIILWAPFFIVNIMTAWCKACIFDTQLITVCVWLGYVSSTLNPIIYTIFNRTFKITFIKLLRCNYSDLERHGSVRGNYKAAPVHYQSTSGKYKYNNTLHSSQHNLEESGL